MSTVLRPNDDMEIDFDPFSAGEFERVIPTTEAQREVWLADRLDTKASLAYNESINLNIEGALDVQALRTALNRVVARHDALRATFSADGLQLLIAAPAPLVLVLDDLSMRADANTELAKAQAVAMETPFDLESGPLLRAHLFRFSPQRHVLQLVAHHAICDGWSWSVIVRDLGLLYTETRGAGPGPEQAPSYSDYAAWEHRNVATQELNLAFWLKHYAGHALPVLELPLDRARAPVRSFASRRVDTLLDAPLVNAVRRLGARSGASLFATLFSTFAAMVSRLAQQEDLVIGVPSAGQAVSDMPDLVGHCVNLLPIRVDIDGQQPFNVLLRQVSHTVLDAFDHQTLTYGTLLKQLPLPRDPSRPSLVSVMFNLDPDSRRGEAGFDDLRVRTTSQPRHYDNFELFLNAAPTEDGLQLEFQYNTALFDETTARRWLALYRAMLERLIDAPELSVAAAAAPTAADNELLARFNATAMSFDRHARIEALIAKQASETPDAPAVIAGDVRLSYGQLDRRANALALRLQAAGVRAGDLVGLSCARNEHMLVALLGILKSGAGYVPLDPSFPRERLDFMSEDAGLSLVVADHPATPAGSDRGIKMIAADDPTEAAAAPTHGADAEQVAYVIYTSGSTGRPKGVRVPHRSVVNLLHSLQRTPGITARHTTLAVTTLSFDIAVSEAIMPLTVGACIVVADKDQAMNGDNLRQLVETHDVRFVDATPSTWRLLLESGWPGRADLLAICTGEPLPPDLARALQPMVGQLWNAYGPTETTVWSSFHQVGRDEEAPLPIGQPIDNTAFHVLDAHRNPLPVGVTGELYIAGAGVTLGYLNRPELTVERFVEPPGEAAGTERWYRTGDLGRWRADGVLECLGRADQQVKVRGYRIELGEIEANLVRHPQVERALVITREDQPGNLRIVAYVVARGTMPPATDLKRYLADFLPEYMLPQHFMPLDAFPLLPNGKVDRKALPSPRHLTLAKSDSQQPTSEFDRQILSEMTQVLGLGGMSFDEDFFALGGHSLLAARLTMRLSRQLGIKVPMSLLFEAPTPARLSAALQRLKTSTRTVATDSIVAVPNRTAAPLTPIQEWMRFMADLHPGRSDFNAPTLHRLTGPLNVALFHQALQQIVQRQSALRTCIGPHPEIGAPALRIVANVQVAMPVVDLSELPLAERETELASRLQSLADLPFDIYDVPLFRFALFRMAQDDHVFIFVPHHMVWDGWSFDIFQAELSTLYRCLVEGRPHDLPPLAFSYGDYAAWYAHWLEGAEAARQLAHWKQRFVSAPQAAPLPTDRPRPANGASGGGGVLWFHIEAALTQRLREVARQHDVTLNMLMLSVYTLLLADLSPSDAVVIAAPVRAREVPEAEAVMGFFNNMLPIPLQLDRTLRLDQFSAYVKRELLSFMDCQMVPFARLLDEPEFADRFHGPGLYQALFSFQDARQRPVDIGGLGHQQLALRQKGVADDLALWLMDKPLGLEGTFAYNSDIYLPATGEALRQRYLELLDKVAAQPQLSISEALAPEGSSSAAYLKALAGRAAIAPVKPAPAAAAPVAPAPAPLLQPEQARLAQVWASILGIDVHEVRATDNFFDLGGDSLLAMRAVRQAEQVMGFKIEPRRYVFENLGQLAAITAAMPVQNDSASMTDEPARKGLLGRLFGRGK